MRSGDIAIANGRSWDIGGYGYNWSTIATTKRFDDVVVPSTYYFGFTATGILHSGGPDYRWLGFPLRYPKKTITSLLPTLYFVRSGWIDISNSRLQYLGNYGYECSRVASSKLNTNSTALSAHYLFFGATGIGPSAGPYNRWNSFPLRCLNNRTITEK